MEQHIFKGIPIYDAAALTKLEELFEDHRTEILAALPWLVSEMAVHIGFREALEFIFINGGRKFYIRDDREDLSRKFGLDLPVALHEQILKQTDSSGNVEIPSPWGVSERIRWAIITSFCKRGMSREEIRQIFGVSSRGLTKVFGSFKKARPKIHELPDPGHNGAPCLQGQ